MEKEKEVLDKVKDLIRDDPDLQKYISPMMIELFPNDPNFIVQIAMTARKKQLLIQKDPTEYLKQHKGQQVKRINTPSEE